MPEELAQRVARIEEHIAHQNGTLVRIELTQAAGQIRIEGKQDELADDLHDLAESMACFKGIWATAGVVFAALVGTVLSLFSKKLGS